MESSERVRAALSPGRNLRAVFVRSRGHLASLDGLRALSILWVVLFHAGWYSLWYVPPATYVALLESRLMLPVWRGDFGVDVFFVLSGFLIAGMLIDERERIGRVRVGLFQIRRFLRTWPALVVAVGIDIALFNDHPGMVWANLVYASNFVTVTHVCMGWTWSLSIEEQFYVLCPWLLRAVAPASLRVKLLALATMMVLVCAAIAFIVVRRGYHAFDVEIALNRSPGRWVRAFDDLYTKPWMRAGPLLVGVGAACVYRARGIMEAMGRATVTGALGFGVAVGVAAIATHWPIVSGAPRVLEVAYIASFRTVFGLAVAYGMLFSMSSHPLGRVLGRVLSARFWYPFAQLSYAAYLLNPMASTLVHRTLAPWVGRSHTPPMLVFIPADIVATFFAATALHVFVERPVLELRPRERRTG
jgi:peptidoglycan/LPS O-acetylase OafA/YrhL